MRARRALSCLVPRRCCARLSSRLALMAQSAHLAEAEAGPVCTACGARARLSARRRRRGARSGGAQRALGGGAGQGRQPQGAVCARASSGHHSEETAAGLEPAARCRCGRRRSVLACFSAGCREAHGRAPTVRWHRHVTLPRLTRSRASGLGHMMPGSLARAVLVWTGGRPCAAGAPRAPASPAAGARSAGT